MTEQDVYERLREHLHQLPVGFPSTQSGVELRILKRLFTDWNSPRMQLPLMK